MPTHRFRWVGNLIHDVTDKNSEEKTEKVLRHAQVILRPIVAWLLRSGVTYSVLVSAVKLVFLEQAEQELKRQQQKCNDSSVSTISGLNRKIVKELWRDTQDLNQRARALGRPSLASRVMTRWLEDMPTEPTQEPETQQPSQGAVRRAYPMHLPYTGAGEGDVESFENLVYEVSLDVRPRSALNELLRLGMVSVDMTGGKEWVTRQAAGFFPSLTSDESLDLFSGAISDHLWTGVNNISQTANPELERSIFASNMSEASIQELGSFAQKEWQRIFPRVVSKARQLYEDDVANKRGGYRMRIGMYFHGDADTSKADIASENSDDGQ